MAWQSLLVRMAQQFVDMCRRSREATVPNVSSVVARAAAPTARDPRASAGRGPEGAGLVSSYDNGQADNEATCQTVHTGVKVGPLWAHNSSRPNGDTSQVRSEAAHDRVSSGSGQGDGRSAGRIGQQVPSEGGRELPSVEGTYAASNSGGPEAGRGRRRGISQRGSAATSGRWRLRRLSLRKREEISVLPRGQSQIATRTLTEKATGGNVYIPSGAGNPINTGRAPLSTDAPSAPSKGEAA